MVTVALLVWLVVPDQQIGSNEGQSHLGLSGVKAIVSRKSVWLQAIIVTCAYVGYKSTDDFSLYASDAFGYNDVAAAQIGTISFWLRPLAAVLAGILADKFSPSKMTLISFGLVVVGSVGIASGIVQPNMYWALILIIATTSLGIYALRGIYFALFQESEIPITFTGSAVGLVSFLGFTPDIFMGPLMGFLIDRSPGELGHQHVFIVVGMFATIGMVTTLGFRKYLHH